jgi:response regulator RpfG family c-di-GMP phosphodiesterase
LLKKVEVLIFLLLIAVLTEEKMKIMRKHPGMGFKLLNETKRNKLAKKAA